MIDSSPTESNLVKNNDLLLIIRGLAALSVVLWHAGGHMGGWPAWITVPGRSAVWLFFGISGYVIAFGFIHGRYKINSQDLKDFYINRLLRIYPIFIVLSFLGWATELWLSGKSPIVIDQIPSQIFALQFNQSYIINGVFWTLGIELQFYLFAPVIYLLFFSSYLKRLWLPISLAFYAGLIYLQLIVVEKYSWSVDSRNLIFCLLHFVTGMIACKAVRRINKNNIKFFLCLIIGLAVLGFGNYLYRYQPADYWTVKGVLLVDFAVAALIFAHAYWKGGSGAVVYSLSYLGLLSYGLYAWHGYWLKTIPSLVDHALFLVIISLATAYCTHRWIEKPFLGFRRAHVASC